MLRASGANRWVTGELSNPGNSIPIAAEKATNDALLVLRNIIERSCWEGATCREQVMIFSGALSEWLFFTKRTTLPT